MNKYIPAMVIGLVVAIVFGFVMSFVFTDGPQPIFYGGFAGAFTAYILSNLAGNKKLAIATGPERDQALRLRPPAGKSLLVVYREGFVAKLAGLNLFIDGKAFAQLTAPKFTAIVVPAGPHNLSCGFGGLAGPQSKKGSFDFIAPADGFVAVRIGVEMGLVQGAMSFTPSGDAQALKPKLAGMPMVKAEPAEV